MLNQKNFNARSVSIHDYSMVPRADIPRSSFTQRFTVKTTFDADYLIPVYINEVLPGDTFNLHATFFVRMQTPIVPILDNIHLDTFFFYIPNRLLWDFWEDFITGNRSYRVPTVDITASNQPPVSSLLDYMGVPINLKRGVALSALPFRAYNLVYNEWFRDENLCLPALELHGNDSTLDVVNVYKLLKRGKRFDYFTSSLPWPQKGPSGVTPGSQPLFPVGTYAPVITPYFNSPYTNANLSGQNNRSPVAVGTPYVQQNQMFADLSEAAGATVNNLRLAFATAKIYEKDARGGTRYTESLRQHFGVVPPDSRLQRPEYLGGGSTHMSTSPIPQTSATANTPLGQLGAYSTGLGRHGFTKSFVEHGIVLGLICARGDITYSQGIPRWMRRSTRFDYYWPSLAYLGEQPTYNYEIYMDPGSSADDNKVFGYQERWGEYRSHLSTISGYFTPGIPGTLDFWHLSQNFTSLPTLSSQFIEQNTPMSRILAAGKTAAGLQFLLDSAWENRCARPLPMYSVPGNLDRF